MRKGREADMRQFLRLAGHDAADCLENPCDVRTYEKCKLDPAERERKSEAYASASRSAAIAARRPGVRCPASRSHRRRRAGGRGACCCDILARTGTIGWCL